MTVKVLALKPPDFLAHRTKTPKMGHNPWTRPIAVESLDFVYESWGTTSKFLIALLRIGMDGKLWTVQVQVQVLQWFGRSTLQPYALLQNMKLLIRKIFTLYIKVWELLKSFWMHSSELLYHLSYGISVYFGKTSWEGIQESQGTSMSHRRTPFAHANIIR